MAKNDNLGDFLTDIADAIRAKKGISGSINAQNFASEIASISTGGGVTINNQEKSVDITENGTTEVVADAGFTGLSKVSINVNVPTSGGGGGGESTGGGGSDVRFLDYDGTLLYSFSKDDFLALSALPDLPSRAGLTCQGWNYTLEDAQEYVTSYGVLDVGATYITDDGKTRLYIKIAAEGRMTVPLYFTQTVANGVTIDWGDGSATETLSGTGYLNTTHTYSEIGEYTISLNPSSGCTLGFGYRSNSYCIMGSTGNAGRVYCNMLKAVEMGNNVTSIGNYAFNSCYSLASIVIPSSVTRIDGSAFYNCYGMAYYDFRASKSVPTLSSTNAFGSIPSDCKIVVPDSLYDTWIAATNWSTHASKIIKASEFNG